MLPVAEIWGQGHVSVCCLPLCSAATGTSPQTGSKYHHDRNTDENAEDTYNSQC